MLDSLKSYLRKKKLNNKATGRVSTNPVTNKNIKDDAVPPALIEVRQHMVECYLHTISPAAELSKLRIFIQSQCLQHMKKHSFSVIEKGLRCFTYMWTSW